MRIPFLTPKKELSPRRQMLRTIFAVVFAIMFALGLLLAVISFISNASFYEPKTADGVLGAASTPSTYVWALETVANVNIPGGGSDRFDGARTAVIDTGRNRFQATIDGLYPDTTVFLSDGTTSLYRTSASVSAGAGGYVLNNVCRGQKPVSASLLEMPAASEIQKLSPNLVSSSANYTGLPAWELTFKPNGSFIEQLLWLPFLDAVSPHATQWNLPPQDRQALESGNFKIVDARAFVTKNKPRELVEVAVEVVLPASGDLKILASVHSSGGKEPLKDMRIAPPACG